MGPFYVNNTFDRHLGRHLVSNKLSNDKMIHIIKFHNLMTQKEQFRNNTSVRCVHFI